MGEINSIHFTEAWDTIPSLVDISLIGIDHGLLTYVYDFKL